MARILIVDDSPTEVFALSRLLKGHGFEVCSATSGEEAIQKARRERLDLILMDVVMPGINGFQATRRLAKDAETAAIPIIMVTNKGQETDRIWGLRQGARDYVIKPPAEAELLGKIRALLSSANATS